MICLLLPTNRKTFSIFITKPAIYVCSRSTTGGLWWWNSPLNAQVFNLFFCTQKEKKIVIRLLVLFVLLISMDPCSCCHGELLVLSRASGAAMCLSHTRTHAKIIGVWKIQSCWISTMFWHFHLKGHNWLSARICDAAGGGNYSESKTMQGRNTAQNGPSRSALSSFAALIPFTTLLWWAIGAEALKGKTSGPSSLN